MTTYCIRALIYILGFLYFGTIWAQDNFTGYFQPKTSLNYKVTESYSHNFSITQRHYIYHNSTVQLTTRQLDFTHFSKLKIKSNQSIALGIQYRFRAAFETGKENELRLTQQYNTTFKRRAARLGHRFRTEQRITDLITTHRFRYRFTLDFPLQGTQLNLGEAYLITNTESLLSISTANSPQYDQRFTAHIGWLLCLKTKLQAGIEYRFENYIKATKNIFFITTSLMVSL